MKSHIGALQQLAHTSPVNPYLPASLYFDTHTLISVLPLLSPVLIFPLRVSTRSIRGESDICSIQCPEITHRVAGVLIISFITMRRKIPPEEEKDGPTRRISATLAELCQGSHKKPRGPRSLHGPAGTVVTPSPCVTQLLVPADLRTPRRIRAVRGGSGSCSLQQPPISPGMC